MVDFTLPLLRPPPVFGKLIEARFDRHRLSSNGGLLVFREVEKRLGVAGHRHSQGLAAKTQQRYAQAKAADPFLPVSFKLRCFKEIYDGAKSW